MSEKRFHVCVSGRVQGVGYRYYARDVALSLGLCGWVRNVCDGSVELEVQGEQRSIDRFLEELKEGPSLSRVTDLKIREIASLETCGDFLIRH